MAQTLGFYTLDDFKQELRRRGLGALTSAIRCEALTTDTPTKMGDDTPGPPNRQYHVTLTVYDKPAGEVLACDVHTGSGLAVFADREPHAANLIKAHKLIKAHLEGAGFEVLPGEYAHEPTGRAICDLWRYGKERQLVALGEVGDLAQEGG